jgi:hypothetical protein
LGPLHTLYDRFRDRVAFFVVYIKEAHPEDAWVLTSNRQAGIAVTDPTTETDRSEVASTCAVRMSMRIPRLLDGMTNQVARQYGGWPDRLYLVGTDGRVAWQGEPGPSGFKPGELEAAIEKELRLAS